MRLCIVLIGMIITWAVLFQVTEYRAPEPKEFCADHHWCEYRDPTNPHAGLLCDYATVCDATR